MKLSKKQRAMLRRDVAPHVSWMTSLLDDLDETEARAELGAQVVEAARARLECWTRETYDALVGALRLYDAALAETANKTSERDGREGGCAVAPLPDVQLHPSRPAEALQEPGTSSHDDAFPVVVGCSVGPYSSRACELGTHGCVVVHAGTLDSVTRNKTEGRGIPRTNDDSERRGNIHPEPGTSSPDDAERAAREWWDANGEPCECDAVHTHMTLPGLDALAAILRTRDAQAREAGRVEERADMVAFCRLCAANNGAAVGWMGARTAKDLAALDARRFAFLADQFERGEHITRPDRAKGGE